MISRSWFDKNLSWLQLWLKEVKETSNNVGQQTFMSSKHYRGQPPNELLKDEADQMLLFTLVFGTRRRRTNYLNGAVKYPTRFAGFLQIKGRLPTKKDKVIIFAYEWMKTPAELGWNSIYIRRTCKPKFV